MAFPIRYTHHQPLVHFDSLLRCRCYRIFMDILELTVGEILFKRGRNNFWFYSLFQLVINIRYGHLADVWRGPTIVCRISFRRGLFEASITRFPTNFSSHGTRRAWGRTQLCFGSDISCFDLKKFMTVRWQHKPSARCSSSKGRPHFDGITDTGTR